MPDSNIFTKFSLVLQAFLLGDELECLVEPACTPLAVVSRARKPIRVSTTATDSANSDILSKEGTVIGAVLST
jgi:hypothetical protein